MEKKRKNSKLYRPVGRMAHSPELVYLQVYVPKSFYCRMRGFICGDRLEFGLVSCLSGGVVLEIYGCFFLFRFPMLWRPIFSASCERMSLPKLPSLCDVLDLLPASILSECYVHRGSSGIGGFLFLAR
jgi:hypothetical protein